MTRSARGGRGTNQYAVKPVTSQPQDASVLADLAGEPNPEPERSPVPVPVLVLLVLLAVVGAALALMAVVGVL